MTQRPFDSVTQQKSEPIYRPFLQSAIFANLFKDGTIMVTQLLKSTLRIRLMIV